MKRLITFVLLVFCATVTLNAQSDVELETNHTTGYIDGKYPPYFQSVDGVLYATAQYDFGWTLIKYPASKAETEYTILPYTVRIAKGAFQGATALRVINIPSSVKYIGENAFDDCPSLLTLNCYDGKAPVAVAPITESPTPHEVARFNISGKPCLPTEKGLQIIVFSDYTTQTVINE